MKTRYTPLVTIKKELMERCERDLKKANADLAQLQAQFDAAYAALRESVCPQSGSVHELLGARTLLEAQRRTVESLRAEAAAALSRLQQCQKLLKSAIIEYEKFKYLETEEIRGILKKRELQERRELDEIAVQNFQRGAAT